jgi:phosphotriesterase-related protein
MLSRELVGKAQTVLGPISAEDLGITLTHEHLVCDMSCYFVEPEAASEKALAYQAVSAENLGWLSHNPLRNLDNVRLWDKELAVSEVLRFKRSGGSTVVDVTNTGMGRDPRALQYISRCTGLNIIMGSGYYLGISHPVGLSERSEDEIAEEIVRDVMVGVGDTGVRAGIIGELGCSYPLTKGEAKVLRAAAQAQKKTGAPVTIHPGYPYEVSVFEIIEIFTKAGGDLNHTIICHLDYIEFTKGIQAVVELVEAGCYVEYDLFGRFGYAGVRGKLADVPSAGERLTKIRQLIDRGCLSKILISQDTCLKIRLTRYGGTGYATILDYTVPLMRVRGFAEEWIRTLLVDNPKHLLQFV